MFSVETIISLAIKPVTSEEADCQLPKPAGSKAGAIQRLTAASALFSASTCAKLASPAAVTGIDTSSHTMIEAMRMTLVACSTKPFVRSQVCSSTLLSDRSEEHTSELQ